MARSFLLYVTYVLCVFSTDLGVAQTNPSCPRGNWSYFAKSNKCLQVFVNPLTWSQAEEYCNIQARAGHLAAMESDDEITFAVSLAHQTGYDDGGIAEIHIGLAYSGASGWGRPDGSDLTYLKWYINNDGQLGGNYPAGDLCTRRQFTGYMTTTNANVARPFICQANPITEG